MIVLYLILYSLALASTSSGVREVSGSSCDIIPINLALGMTTQIVLEQAPKVTLYADKKHFKINTNRISPRSLAIIPYIESNELAAFRNSSGRLPPPAILAHSLNKNYKTNLIVFFENSNQLMFEMRFVEKKKADLIVKVTQEFKKGCAL